MNDSQFAQQKSRIQTLIDRWIGPLGLKWWDIEIGYCRSDFEVNGKPEPSAVGRCQADWRYMHAYIEFNMVRVAEITDRELERAFVHELMHVFLKETRETGRDWLDHEERVASSLANAFLWLRESLCQASEGSGAKAAGGNGFITIAAAHNGTSSTACTSTDVHSPKEEQHTSMSGTD